MKPDMIFNTDKYLEPYKGVIESRHRALLLKKQEISGYGKTLSSAVNNHLYYMLHQDSDSWVFREWAPNASAIFLVGDFNSWEKSDEFKLCYVENGNWEIRVPKDVVKHGDLYKWIIEWDGGSGERIPAYAARCVQDADTKLFSAQVWAPKKEYRWKQKFNKTVSNPLIYETHIGMSSEDEKVASFNEFRENVLPRIASLGYNTIQLMALQEHPYYGSFGYQVSSFFALSSRFGTPEEFKQLVDQAHKLGISVVMDIVHSHSVDNVLEGLGTFDGTEDLYFHSMPRGRHPAWQSLCFDYGKDAVVHFLLSNVKYWMEEYHLDGFRFDGVTSMIYYDHGLGKEFTDYSCYFDGSQDEDALNYLGLANILVKEINGNAITIAEDVSGMPGLAAPVDVGGFGFDFRMSMGVSDHWIKWIKEVRDEDWNMGEIYHELTNKREDEKTISYAECHDQAMVGDKTIIFRLIDKEMYFSMAKSSQSHIVDRGMALHKMIRLITLATAGDGYLNFMGNEFGHPEWIDFPRAGNNWSYFYARRQWSLVENDELRYKLLLDFDSEMIGILGDADVLTSKCNQLYVDEQKKVLIFGRGCFIFAFNFNSSLSFSDFTFAVTERATAGNYKMVLDTDSECFGGAERNNAKILHSSRMINGAESLSLYLPCRSAQVLKLI